MKKILAITLLVCMILTIFTGCNKVEEPKTTETAGVQEPVKAEPIASEPTQIPATTPDAETTIEPVLPTESKAEAAKAIEEKAVLKPKAEEVKTAEPAKTTEVVNTTEPVKKEEKSDTVTFTDNLGKTITIKKNPQRVVCLHTSYLDLWDLAGGKVVGRVDTKESVPASAKDVETVGLYTTPNLEKILALQPDLILLNTDVNSHVALIPILEKNNIPYAALRYDTFKDYLKMLKIYTDLTDRDDLYQSKGVAVAKKVDAIIAKVPKSKKPSVLLLLGSSKSVSVRLPNTTVGEMLQDLGTVNTAYDASLTAADMEVFSMEKVIERNPEFIFVQTMGNVDETTARIKKDIEVNPAWGYLDAVKEGKYIFLPK
ncbi:MAG: transporter substrate-binding protein, partial [Clostridia bacterium]|nr:transporter substrate-binding protein [Clostridia bacterium]